MSAHPFLDDAQVEIIRAMARPYIGPRKSWASVEADEPGRAGPNIDRWMAEAATAESVYGVQS